MIAFVFDTAVLLQGGLWGVIFGLLAVGLVLVFRSSNVVNFAHAELGLIAAAMCEVLVARAELPFYMTFPAALGTAATLGALCEFVVIRRLRNAPRVMTVVATLGLSQFLLFVTAAVRGASTSEMPTPPGFPEGRVGSFYVNRASSAILILGPMAVIGVWYLLAKTASGRLIRGAAANPDAARLAGLSPSRASAIAWATAGALSGLSSILITGSLGAAAVGASGPTLLIPAIAAAVLARFSSIWIAFGAGVVLGIVDRTIALNVAESSKTTVVMFAIVLVGLVIQAPRLAAAGRSADQSSWMTVAAKPLSAKGERVRLALGLLAGIGTVVYGITGTSETATSLTLIVATATVALSVYVITGMTGQLSLGQYAVAGVGAVVGIRVANATGELLAGFVAAGLAGAVTTVIISLPGLRVRGLFSAVTTLAFALMAREWLLAQPWMAGSGIELKEPTILGMVISSTRGRFGVAVSALIIVAVITRNLSVSSFGRRVMALRDNEPQARGFGVPALRTRLVAFGWAGFIAGVAGVMIALVVPSITANGFGTTQSINAVAAAVLGGLQSVAGPMLGAAYLIGIPEFLSLDSAGLAATAFGWLVLVLVAPNGLYGLLSGLISRFVPATKSQTSPSTVTASGWSTNVDQDLGESLRSEKEPRVLLEATGLLKHFGGVRAVDGVDLTVYEGEIVGLIGSNGAGKTTLFELLGGFVKPGSGTIEFCGNSVGALLPEQRSQLGIVRSFQDAALFSTFTVREVLSLAAQGHHRASPLLSLVSPGRAERKLAAEVERLIGQCGLSGYSESVVSTLSTGTRRIVELASMIALRPKLLLLDEPSAGIAQRETEALANVIRSVQQLLGTTIVLIEHDIPFVRALSNRVVAMEAGVVIAAGAADEVLSNPRVIASYLGSDEAAIARSGDEVAPLDNVLVASNPQRMRALTVPTVAARSAQRKRRATEINRKLAWTTLPLLLLTTLATWAEPRWGTPKWITSTSNSMFTFNFLGHTALSIYVFGFPRARRSARTVHIYLGYLVLAFTLASQSLVGVEPLHSILIAPLWILIGAHVAFSVKGYLDRQNREADSLVDEAVDAAVAPASPGRSGSGPRIPIGLGVNRSAAALDLSMRFPPLAIGAIGLLSAAAALFIGANPTVIRSGAPVMPAAFLGIICIHVLLFWQWIRLRRASDMKLGWVVPVLIAALATDNVMLALGNLLGEGSLLRTLNVPRYWLHATGTPLAILMVLEVGAKCGIEWCRKNRTTWWVFTGVLIALGIVYDGFGQKLEFTTDGEVSRYANEVVSGPPVGSVAVILIVLTVAFTLWNRGYRATMALHGLVMLFGAAIGATFPVIGNVVECSFVVSLLAGMQAVAGHHAPRIRRSRLEPLGIPWTPLSMAGLCALLSSLFFPANVDDRLGPVLVSTTIAALVVGLLSMGLMLYRQRIVSGVFSTLTRGAAVVGVVLFAVDAALLMPVNSLDAQALESGFFRSAHELRWLLMPLAVALLVPFVMEVCGVLFDRRLAPALSFLGMALVMGVGVFAALGSNAAVVRSGYVWRFAPTGLGTPGLLSIALISAMLVAAGAHGVLQRQPPAEPTVCVLAFISLLSCFWGGPNNPFVIMISQMFLVMAIIAGALFAAGRRIWPAKESVALVQATPQRN